MKLIGLAGTAGSGKSTVARILVERHGFVEVSLADPLKRFLAEVFQWDEETLWGPSGKRNRPDSRYPRPVCRCSRERRGAAGVNIDGCVTCGDCGRIAALGAAPSPVSPRLALQLLGTEYGRALYEDVWIDHALRVVNCLHNPSGYFYDRMRWSVKDSSGRHNGRDVVISDVRFENEASKIRAVDGRIWRVVPDSNRPPLPLPGLDGAAAQHASERELPDDLIDDTIVNPFEIESLGCRVEALLAAED